MAQEHDVDEDGQPDLLKHLIKQQEMPEEMAEDAIAAMKKALRAGGDQPEKEIARAVKLEMDKKHGEDWQCVVGRNFGSHVTYEDGSYIYFYVGKVAVLLFKST